MEAKSIYRFLPVQFLGTGVGNLWDVTTGDTHVARITFEDNRLVAISGKLSHAMRVEFEDYLKQEENWR